MQLQLVQLWVSSYRALFWGVWVLSMRLQHNNLTVEPVIYQTPRKKQNFPLQSRILIFTENIFGTLQTVIYGNCKIWKIFCIQWTASCFLLSCSLTGINTEVCASFPADEHCKWTIAWQTPLQATLLHPSKWFPESIMTNNYCPGNKKAPIIQGGVLNWS